MLVLFETPAGFALFKLHDDGKLENADGLFDSFKNVEGAKKAVSLQAFKKFEDTADALAAATAINEGKLSKNLKKFLQKTVAEKKLGEKLAVADAKLKTVIREKLSIETVHDDSVMELMRCIRFQLNNLISENMSDSDLHAMALGLSHSLSRYKIKFSPDKVDVMIVQAISLLDDLDKEINTYSMRVKEWYGLHFPELAKVITDNIQFAKVVKQLGPRTQIAKAELNRVVEEGVADEIRAAAQVSMGTDISQEDIDHIVELCEQVLEVSTYREQLYEYVKNRMRAIAPNLTVLVGELVGARLIAHAGSLLNLAKHPASTVQILGAEKALFRALKAKKQTPKYGLIYHASLVGQTAPKFKGKISRVLANKAALAIRVDALGDKDTKPVGAEGLEQVQLRMRQLEGDFTTTMSKTPTGKQKKKYDKPAQGSTAGTYNAAADSTLGEMEVEPPAPAEHKEKKDKIDKKDKKDKKKKREEENNGEDKKSKKRKHEDDDNGDEENVKKKKKHH